MNYLKIILGNIFMTFAYAYIAVPFGIVNGGVTSFAMVLNKNLPGNISFWTNTLYLSLLIIYYIFMGYKCFINALFSCIAFILFFTLFTAFPLMLPLPFFLAVPCMGILIGIGYYFCISARSTALGFDTIAIILHDRNPKINLALTIYICNVIVLLSGLFTYGIVSVIAGIICSGLQSFVLNLLTKRNKKRI
ncbi:YitT family protein [Megamonas hypermegale]|uniref:YitT family protein n=1 Tax=Megamonas hypermegale TaxID=158847 RepID=UPI0025A40B0C|nr:YitT family protein [Megamonas hypermegale]MDM8142615.1 YitT family protein [Megamonas hypermegale]